MNKKLQHLFDYFILGNASISKGDKFQENYSKFIGTGWYMAYFFFNKKEAIIQSKKLFINPSAEIARKVINILSKVWNLVDTKGIKNLYKLALPSIKYRKKLYFRRNLPEVNLGFISDMLFKLEEKKWDCSYKLQLGYASRLTKDSIISKEKSNKGENLLDAANNLNSIVI